MFQKYILHVLLFFTLLFALPCLADVWVNGYTRKDGTQVKGHWRSSPNGSKADNWSTKGNVNPYTGEVGTKSLDDYGYNEDYDAGDFSTTTQTQPSPEPSRPKFGGYQATPYVRRGPPKAEGGWADTPPAKEKAKEEPKEEFRVVPEKPKSKPPTVKDDHTVYCSMRLREYHWRYDCNLLKNSRPVPLTIKSVKDVGYAECRECRPGDEDNEVEAKPNPNAQPKRP